VRAAVAGACAGFALSSLVALAVFIGTLAPPCYCVAPLGMVWGAADITLDGGKTREYRLVIRADDDNMPYTIRVDKATYDHFTEQLGKTWP
jgi:hypothetical protein